MAVGAKTDQFPNIAAILVTESAANTLTYAKLNTNISVMEKVAWIIARIEYDLIGGVAGLFNASADSLTIGLSTYNGLTTQVTANAAVDSSVIDRIRLERVDLGTAASGFMHQDVMTRDFSSLPGGGLIVPPNPLYGFVQGVSLTAAYTAVIRLYYTAIVLATDQYWELVEARRVLTV